MLLDVIDREHRFFADNFAYTRNIAASLTAAPQEGQADGAECGSLTLSYTGGQQMLVARAAGLRSVHQ